MSELKLRPGAAPASGFFSGKRRYLLPLLLVLVALVGWRLFFGSGQARKGMNMDMPPVRVAPSLATGPGFVVAPASNPVHHTPRQSFCPDDTSGSRWPVGNRSAPYPS